MPAILEVFPAPVVLKPIICGQFEKSQQLTLMLQPKLSPSFIVHHLRVIGICPVRTDPPKNVAYKDEVGTTSEERAQHGGLSIALRIGYTADQLTDYLQLELGLSLIDEVASLEQQGDQSENDRKEPKSGSDYLSPVDYRLG
jgi:hypothetical protein